MLDTSLFKTHSLEQQQGAALMTRREVKFILSLDRLNTVLGKLREHYSVLEINQQRSFQYKSIYFDTDNLKFYRMHHNGQLARFKVRIRRYIETQSSFFEVKHKNVKGITSKYRLPIGNQCDDYHQLTHNEKILASKLTELYAAYSIDNLKASLDIEYQRATLLAFDGSERLTIDRSLEFHSLYNGKVKKLPNLAVIEIKRDENIKTSFVYQLLRDCAINSISCSKYCLGVAYVYDPIVKKNQFIPLIREISRLEATSTKEAELSIPRAELKTLNNSENEQPGCSANNRSLFGTQAMERAS